MMAEIVGLAASIAALLQVSQYVLGYLSDIRDASEERIRLLLELSSITGILLTLKDLAQRAEAGEEYLDAIRSLHVPNGPLAQFKSALDRLAKKLEPATGLRRVGKVLAWPFKKEEIKDILGIIERSKTRFTLALQGDTLELSKAIKNDIAGISEKVENMQITQTGMYDCLIITKKSWHSP